MKITNCSIIPTNASNKAGKPSLTPELLAAVGARYSRNNEGLDSILSNIDPNNADASVERIFKFVDYGHASIADMVPVALFMDDLSIFDVYFLWSICPQAGGQESSSRYIKLDRDGLCDPNDLGIDNIDTWYADMNQAFDLYQSALKFWGKIAEKYPDVTRIPKSLLDTNTDKAKKQVERMRRNYVFDRARIFLPVAAKTNVMMIQSARAWVQAIQILLSHPLPSLNKLGEAIRHELSFSAPHLINHARFEQSANKVLVRRFKRAQQGALRNKGNLIKELPESDFLYINEDAKSSTVNKWFLEDITDRTNRYSLVGESLSMVSVCYGMDAISMGEMRDMNRHRTGSKLAHLVPVGFYTAQDQLPKDITQELSDEYNTLIQAGFKLNQRAFDMLCAGDKSYIYHTYLGTQYRFAQVTTGDKFIYTMELRTGIGSHYRYAKHCHNILEQWYTYFPEHRGVILEGTAEPE